MEVKEAIQKITIPITSGFLGLGGKDETTVTMMI